MWPFKSDKQRAIEQFSHLVSPDVIKEILSAPESEFPARRAHGGFLLIQMRDDDGEAKIERRLIEISDWCQENQGHIAGSAASLLLVLFNVVDKDVAESARKYEENAALLIARFGTQVKALYSTQTVSFGVWGTGNFSSFGVMPPHFSHHLKQLCDLNWGVVQQIVERK